MRAVRFGLRTGPDLTVAITEVSVGRLWRACSWQRIAAFGRAIEDRVVIVRLAAGEAAAATTRGATLGRWWEEAVDRVVGYPKCDRDLARMVEVGCLPGDSWSLCDC